MLKQYLVGLMLTILVCMIAPAAAHTGPAGDDGRVLDVILVPDYQLPERAANETRPWPRPKLTDAAWLSFETDPLLLFGQAPTERMTSFETAHELDGDFTAELWLCDHVNRDVGVVLRLINQAGEAEEVALSYWDDEVRLGSPGGVTVSGEFGRKHKFKKYWLHVAVVRSGEVLRLVVNGEEVGQLRGHAKTIDHVELASYMHNEPYMQTANLVNALRVTERVLSKAELTEHIDRLKSRVERGALMERFHFNAGPALQYPTKTTLGILWETDRPAAATIRYGRTADLEYSIDLPLSKQLIREVTLNDLEPDTPYFYEVTATSSVGEAISTGILTARTAVKSGQPFVFGIIGDTESRPHINAQLAEALWRERVDFVLNAGDLTDGGKEPNKFQWNMEYFVGMGSLLARVPTLPVPGNGEGDLYWYNRYHSLPKPEGYYTITYGDVQLFMLDSNQAKTDFAPGGEQYQWLKRELAKSKAKWKIAMHHHPTWTSEQDDYGDTWEGPSEMGDQRVRQIIELYEQGGIDVVIYGHLHAYQRSFPVQGTKTADEGSGIVYLQVGGAGGNLADFAPTRNWFQAKSFPGVHHYVTAEVRGDRIEFRMFDVDGRMRDSFFVDKRVGRHAR